MSLLFLISATLILAILAIQTKRLIMSALWLASVSTLLSIIFYLYGAHQLAVFELSVGAGLVTILFVFAINISGEESMRARSIIPKPFARGLVILAVLLLALFAMPLETSEVSLNPVEIEPLLASSLWQQRALDILVQLVLIFSGVLGMLGLLAEAKAPLEKSVAEEVAARRNRDLLSLQTQSSKKEEELA